MNITFVEKYSYAHNGISPTSYAIGDSSDVFADDHAKKLIESGIAKLADGSELEPEKNDTPGPVETKPHSPDETKSQDSDSSDEQDLDDELEDDELDSEEVIDEDSDEDDEDETPLDSDE